MNNLMQRVLTAVIAAPLVILAILYSQSIQFSVILGLFILVGAWEWAGLTGSGERRQRILYLLQTVVVMALTYSAFIQIKGAQKIVLIIACIWWLYALYQVLSYRSSNKALRQGIIHKVSGWLVLVPCWISLILLHGSGVHGPLLVVFLMLLIWTADSGAYFSGRAWGKHKLAPQVSPGKTIEGVAGAIITGAILSVCVIYFDRGQGYVAALVLAVVTVLFSVLGDLLESLYKRDADIKDSGNILPGHGGMLDRIDSLTAAAPVFVSGLIVLELL